MGIETGIIALSGDCTGCLRPTDIIDALKYSDDIPIDFDHRVNVDIRCPGTAFEAGRYVCRLQATIRAINESTGDSVSLAIDMTRRDARITEENILDVANVVSDNLSQK